MRILKLVKYIKELNWYDYMAFGDSTKGIKARILELKKETNKKKLIEYMTESGIQIGKLECSLTGEEEEINTIIYIVSEDIEQLGSKIVAYTSNNIAYITFKKQGTYIALNKNQFDYFIKRYSQEGNRLSVVMATNQGYLIPILLNSKGNIQFDRLRYIGYRLQNIKSRIYGNIEGYEGLIQVTLFVLKMAFIFAGIATIIALIPR